jgi:hypothetical protein
MAGFVEEVESVRRSCQTTIVGNEPKAIFLERAEEFTENFLHRLSLEIPSVGNATRMIDPEYLPNSLILG